MSVGRDTSLNLAAAVAPVLLLLVVTPAYLQVVGAERFGILAICWTILAAAGLASLGMGPALAYRLALMGEEEPVARSNHVWMALIISFAASLLIAVLALVIARPFFQQYASLPARLKTEIGEAMPMLASLLPLGTLTGVLNGALQGRKRFGALSGIGILNAMVVTVGPLLAALLIGIELPLLIATMLSASALVLLAQLAVSARVVPLHVPSRLSSEQVKGLLGYGAWMSATALVAPFLLLFDRFVVGSISGPAAVAVYVLAFNLLQGLLLVPASLGKAMLPRLAPLATEEEVQQLQSSTLSWLNGLLTPVSIVAIALAAPFLDLWIGAELGKIASPVAAVLLVGGWVHGISHIPSTVVVGRSRPDLLTKLLLACLVPYLLLLYFATIHFGVMGAAAAWALRAACDPILFLHTRPRASDIWPVVTSGALVLCAMMAALAFAWTSAPYWLVMLLILGVACYRNRNVLISSMGELRNLAPGTRLRSKAA